MQVYPMRKKSTLRKRILLPTMLIAFVAMLGGGTVLVLFMQYQLNRGLDAKLSGTAIVFRNSLGPLLAAGDTARLTTVITATHEDNDVAHISFRDSAGKVLAQSAEAVPDSGVKTLSTEIKDAENKTLGGFTLTYSTASVRTAVLGFVLLIAVCISVIELILFVSLLKIFRNVEGTIGDIVGKLRESTSKLAETSSDLSTSSATLTRGVNRQAAAVQETVASMAEMSSMLAQTSGSTQACFQVAGEVGAKTRAGRDVMKDMVSAMEAIQQANGRLQEFQRIIGDIASKTEVIDDIVFKTQLLSLNASIEAARAGQHGRGFAVVAEEVGNLAHMSGKAAKEINLLLEDSARSVDEIVQGTEERVHKGQRVSGIALATFTEISEKIEVIANQVQAIHEATREQEIGIKQSSSAMVMLDETATNNSTVARSSEKSAHFVSGESDRISEITRTLLEITIGSELPKQPTSGATLLDPLSG